MPISDTLKSVRIVTSDELEVNGGRFKLCQGPALKVRGYTTTNIGSRMVKGGDAQPVYVLSDTDIESGGGRWKVVAGQAIPVTDVIGDARGVIQGAAIPVFPVDDSGIYDPNFSFLPTRIANLIIWVTSDTITGVADGNPIQTWPDQSGNGNDLIEAVVARRPLYTAGIINGLPVARFDGSDDIMGRNINFVPPYTQPNTFFLVSAHRSGAVAAEEEFVACRNDAAQQSSSIAARDNAPDVYGMTAGTFINDGNLDSAFHIFVCVFDGASSLFRVDGSETAGDANTRNIEDLTLGAYPALSNFGDVDIAEFGFYNADIGSDGITNIESYLSTKYGISI